MQEVTRVVNMEDEKLSVNGFIVRDRRKALRMSLADLAEKTGIDAGQLSRIERGRVSPHRKTVGRIARALNCSAQEIDPSLIAPPPTRQQQWRRILARINELDAPLADDLTAYVASLLELPHGNPDAFFDNPHVRAARFLNDVLDEYEADNPQRKGESTPAFRRRFIEWAKSRGLDVLNANAHRPREEPYFDVLDVSAPTVRRKSRYAVVDISDDTVPVTVRYGLTENRPLVPGDDIHIKLPRVIAPRGSKRWVGISLSNFAAVPIRATDVLVIEEETDVENIADGAAVLVLYPDKTHIGRLRRDERGRVTVSLSDRHLTIGSDPVTVLGVVHYVVTPRDGATDGYPPLATRVLVGEYKPFQPMKGNE